MTCRCLILDHDNTVVQSIEQLHYPSFCHTLAQLRPGVRVSLTDYKTLCAEPGFVPYCRDVLGFTEEEMQFELADWQAYTRDIIPDAYAGMAPLLARFKEAGGGICVVSHSAEELIRRDYRRHFGFEPDRIYDLTFAPQKPDPAPLLDVMRRTGLPPDQLLVVDDLPPGMQMAQAAGVPFVYAAWGEPAPATDAFLRAHAPTAERPADLERILFPCPA